MISEKPINCNCEKTVKLNHAWSLNYFSKYFCSRIIRNQHVAIDLNCFALPTIASEFSCTISIWFSTTYEFWWSNKWLNNRICIFVHKLKNWFSTFYAIYIFSSALIFYNDLGEFKPFGVSRESSEPAFTVLSLKVKIAIDWQFILSWNFFCNFVWFE